MTADDVAKLWNGSAPHTELVQWLVWNIGNEREPGSLPCPIIFDWELTDEIKRLNLGSKSHETVEILRAAGVLVPRKIEPVKRPNERNKVLPCDPNELNPDGWQIRGEVKTLQAALQERSDSHRRVSANGQISKQKSYYTTEAVSIWSARAPRTDRAREAVGLYQQVAAVDSGLVQGDVEIRQPSMVRHDVPS